jgi:forespore regulator of the sigma-K checkpoint
MNFTSKLKQLKKRLRLNRRWLSLGSVLLVVGACLAWYSFSLNASDKPNVQPVIASRSPERETGADEAVLAKLAETETKREVSTIKTYVCGEEMEQLGRLTPQEIQSIHTEHPQWKVTMNGDSVILREQIEDLSPGCKDTAYFGLDKEGNLSLFDGIPSGQKVIRTFFQLNMGFLESSVPKETIEQLKEGIRVTDLLEYNSVLSTFSDFAVEQ